MAVWSTVSAADIQSSFGRFDAEYYRPENLLAFRRITSNKFELLRKLVQDGYRVVYENTKILSPERVNENSAIFLQATNISTNGLRLDFQSAGYVCEEDWKRYPKGRLQPGEILIEVKGQAEKVTVVPEDSPVRTLVSGSLFKLQVDSSKINPWYIFAFFSTKHGKLLRDRLKTNTLIGFVSKPQLYSIPVAIPEHEEDLQRIAGFAENAYRALRDSEEHYTKAQQLLTSELGLNNLRFEKPMGYIARFSDLETSRRSDAEFFGPVAMAIVEQIKSFSHSTLGASFFVGNGFPWKSTRFLEDNSGEPVVRIRNIRPSHIVTDELTSLEPEYAARVSISKAKKGDVVVGMDGIKYFYASLLEGNCYVNQRVAHLTQKHGSTLSPEYVTFVINSKVGQAQLLRDMTIATTVGHITTRNISKLVIPYVSDDFHREITALVRNSIDKQHESKRLLDQAKSRVEQLIEEAAGI